MSDYDEWDSWDEDCESEEQEVPGFKFNPATGAIARPCPRLPLARLGRLREQQTQSATACVRP